MGRGGIMGDAGRLHHTSGLKSQLDRREFAAPHLSVPNSTSQQAARPRCPAPPPVYEKSCGHMAAGSEPGARAEVGRGSFHTRLLVAMSVVHVTTLRRPRRVGWPLPGASGETVTRGDEDDGDGPVGTERRVLGCWDMC